MYNKIQLFFHFHAANSKVLGLMVFFVIVTLHFAHHKSCLIKQMAEKSLLFVRGKHGSVLISVKVAKFARESHHRCNLHCVLGASV